VTVSFFGDPANNQPTFHQPINLPPISKLPLIFIPQNNPYPQPTPFSYPSTSKSIVHPPAGYNIPAIQLDGRDLIAVYQA
ncbi:thiamine pyrophosphate-dependent enzyme, partial [Bacillus sp. WP8]|uniref:thiamine pyrophosphate-dependent enzyme n=1 Tax=Bacillus sp. WP8 TaxID=756828 RepID=UPI0021B53124